MKRIVIVGVAVVLAGSFGSGCEKKKAAEEENPLGLAMVAYTLPDEGASVLHPKGWTAVPSELGVTFAEDPGSATATRIDVFGLQVGQDVSSEQIVEVLALQMREQYPSFAVVENRQLAAEPDVRGVLFAYREGDVQMSGFGLAICGGGGALWGDIYGRDDGFEGYDPVAVLTYVLQSLAAGTKPNEPEIEAPARSAGSAPPAGSGGGAADDRSHEEKMGESMAMTHFWNNAHYIVPDAFTAHQIPAFL